MLQPAQLREVSARHADAIAEVRTLLESAGLPMDTASALRSLVSKSQEDRGFRRDLASHVWVVVHASGGRIGYGELLGVFAVAAAGIHFAALADERDAHDLLRLLMEARSSFEPSAQTPVDSGKVASIAGPVLVPRAGNAAVDVRAARSGRERRAVWVAAAAVLVALAAGVFWYHRTSASGPEDAVAVPAHTSNNAPSSVTSSAGPGNLPVAGAPASEMPRTVPQRSIPRREVTASSTHSSAESAASAPAVWSQPAVTFPKPAAADVSAVNGSRPPILMAPPPAAPRVAMNTLPKGVVPAAVLSRQLDSPTVPAYAAADSSPSGRWIPHLLRRQPVPASSGDDTRLIAAVDPSEAPFSSGSDAGNSTGGFVRLTSVGIAAESVVYSPAPVYPAAASAAHVQGEVKVQADIDRAGNVASARVVSGPPQLRDAALNAVQHWRYRPRMSSGKPVPMSATTILDFELP